MSITKNDLKELQEIFEKEETITQTAKVFCKRKGITYTDSLRRRASTILNESANFDTETSTVTNQYADDLEKLKDNVEEDVIVTNMPSAWDSDLNRFLSIDEYCDKFGLPKEQVRSSKLVSHVSQHMVYNIAFNPTISEQTGIDEDFIEEVVKKYIKPKVLQSMSSIDSNRDDWVDRLIISDLHIGMSTDGGRNVEPLYEAVWDKEKLMSNIDKVIKHVNQFKRSNTIVIDELGDLVDGLFGETARKGHSLPQNMSDKEAFEAAIDFKVTLIEHLLCLYDKVICNSITEDNHSAVFGYFINSTVKRIIDASYTDERVVYNVLEKFINHYSIGKHTFILSHGKDSESLKFGFKPVLDAKQADKIDHYCKEHNLYNGNFIEFSKGDSHQFILDYTTSRDFDYFNYPSFAPPSNWVKTNFGQSVSGFVFQNVLKEDNIKVITPYFFS